MGITYAILGQGSAFLHGSQTSNGGAADTVLNDLFAFVAYQAMVEKLVPKENVLVHELSLTPRFDNTYMLSETLSTISKMKKCHFVGKKQHWK